jgi:hypothetical protein
VCRDPRHKKASRVALFGHDGANWSAWPIHVFNPRQDAVTQWISRDGEVDVFDPGGADRVAQPRRARYVLACRPCKLRQPVRPETLHPILERARLADIDIIELRDIVAIVTSSKTD